MRRIAVRRPREWDRPQGDGKTFELRSLLLRHSSEWRVYAIGFPPPNEREPTEGERRRRSKREQLAVEVFVVRGRVCARLDPTGSGVGLQISITRSPVTVLPSQRALSAPTAPRILHLGDFAKNKKKGTRRTSVVGLTGRHPVCATHSSTS